MAKVKSDFKKLGDDLIDEAKRVKKEVADNFNFDDLDGLKKLEQKVEDIAKANDKYIDAQKQLEEMEKELIKTQKKLNDALEDSTETLDNSTDAVKENIKAEKASKKANDDLSKSLDKLYQELEQHRLALKVVNKLEKEGTVSIEDSAVARGRLKLMTKELNAEIRKQEKELTALNKISKQEQKLIEANIVLQKEQAKTLLDVRERIAALRVVVQSLDYEAEAEKIKDYNREIDELTEILGDNSDKFIKSKINVGNYEESIRKALQGSSLFKTNIGVLDGVMESFLGTLTKTRAELDEMEENLGANANSLQRLQIAFGRLNTVLKASVIGLLLVALASLANLFGSTRAGAVRLEKAMQTLGTAFITFGKVAVTIFKGVGQNFTILFDGIKDVIDKNKGKGKLETLADLFTGDTGVMDSLMKVFARMAGNMAGTWNEATDVIQNGTEAVVKGLEYIDKAYKLEDKVRRLSREVERLNGQLAITQLKADDSTRSLQSQLYYAKLALVQQTRLNTKQLQIAKDQLEVVNNKLKQNILANSEEAKNLNMQASGLAFAEQVQKLAEARGVKLEINNDLIAEQQNAILEVIKAENQLALGKEENAKKQREINRDIFEQNLDLLIDLIDTEKNLSEQYVTDVAKNFKKRVEEFNRFLVVFRQNSMRELDEFTKEASNMGLDIKFRIEYDDNGDFKIFANDAELMTNDIVELNKQLQNLGINEIDINRFREYLVETRNGIKDFRGLNKELVLAGINFKQLKSDLTIGENELYNLKTLNREIKDLSEIKLGSLSKKERNKVIKQLEELEKRRTEITEDAELNRQQNRIVAIDRELKTVEVGSSRELELLQEKNDIQKNMQQGYNDMEIQDIKDKNAKIEEAYKKFVEDVQNILGQIIDKALEVNAKRISQQEKMVAKQEEMIDKQEARAQAGLDNTLAYEQRALAQREADLLKSQKKQERLEKIKALYTSYTNYADKGDENPILKALRDFAILESITASFGDGGLVGVDGVEKVRTNPNGITIGRRHSMRGGVLAFHEGGEGFFSRDEVANMGEDNFYKIKQMAGNGLIDSNFFSGQRQEFNRYIAPARENRSDKKVLAGLKEVKNAIENKPVPNWELVEATEEMFKYVETISTKNKTRRNIYIVKKPKL